MLLYLVLFTHHFALSGRSFSLAISNLDLGGIAVLIFFSISGYLITQSYLRTSSKYNYLKKRIFRLYPALIVCSLILFYIICPVFGKGDSLHYIFSFEAFKNFFKTAFLLKPPRSGDKINFFGEDYIYPNALNGSLWTLYFEFVCYLIVLAFFFTKKEVTTKVIILLAFFTITTIITFDQYNGKLYNLSRFGLCFFTGSLLFLLNKYLTKKILSIILFCSISLLLIFAFNQNYINNITITVFLIAIALLTIAVGKLFNDRIINRRFDISYGMYIYAFPVQQLVINETNLSFWTSMLVSLIITIVLAILSWVMVEKRFLQRRRQIPYS